MDDQSMRGRSGTFIDEKDAAFSVAYAGEEDKWEDLVKGKSVSSGSFRYQSRMVYSKRNETKW